MGKLLLAGPSDIDPTRLCDEVYDVINDACLELIAAGRLAREQYERFTMPVYFRTLAKLLAPLQREGSPMRDAFT